MTRRVMGKLAFFTLVDEAAPIQLFIVRRPPSPPALPVQPKASPQLTSLVECR